MSSSSEGSSKAGIGFSSAGIQTDVDSATKGSSTRDLLSKVTRYEALFELTGAINAVRDVESVGEVLARRLKYIADVVSWRYICFDGDLEEPAARESETIVVDGHRGRADVHRTVASQLSSVELNLWQDRKTCILSGEAMRDAQQGFPEHLRRTDLEQIFVNALVENGRTQALHLFGKRRQGFSDLDVKCLSMVCGFFHRKVHTLWEQKKLRDLELAYLQQEVMLRESEKLATLGRLSAGMAHELNNPASAATLGAEQLRTSLTRFERLGVELGSKGLSDEQRASMAGLYERERAHDGAVAAEDVLAQSRREGEVEEWLVARGVEDSWQLAPDLIEMGLSVETLDALADQFDSATIPVVIDYLAARQAATRLIDDIASGTRRVSAIVKSLKGYAFMDQAPIQPVDVRQGLEDTLAMLHSKLYEDIRVDLHFDPTLPRIQAYGSELNQVWTHLIENAIEAIGDAGALELKAYEEDEWVVVEVADDGPGIPVESQGKIFDPFFTTKPPGGGAGLGLSVSHAIVVQKHAGQVSVESKPGATRFRVRLPKSGPLDAVDESEKSIQRYLRGHA